MSDLTQYEREVLKEIADPGTIEGLHWGAAMGMALEYLRGEGYVAMWKGTAKITSKGREALEKGDTP